MTSLRSKSSCSVLKGKNINKDATARMVGLVYENVVFAFRSIINHSKNVAGGCKGDGGYSTRGQTKYFNDVEVYKMIGVLFANSLNPWPCFLEHWFIPI